MVMYRRLIILVSTSYHVLERKRIAEANKDGQALAHSGGTIIRQTPARRKCGILETLRRNTVLYYCKWLGCREYHLDSLPSRLGAL